jgi:Trk-type K+ transport system membrane component
MNNNQRILLKLVCAVISAMLVYPPYVLHGYGSGSSTILRTGYTWIFDLPNRASVDASLLIVQWVGVLVVSSVVYVLLHDRK